MRIALASDIHGAWDQIEYPEADILAFIGDIIGNYSMFRTRDAHQQISEVERFNRFLDTLKQYQDIIFVPGNHEVCMERIPEAKDLITNAHYLQDAEKVIQGIKFYGSPWQNWYAGWAFNFANPYLPGGSKRADRQAKLCWEAIPDDVEILLTHSPPKGIMDVGFFKKSLGCRFLAERIKQLQKLKLHGFGHIHFSCGTEIREGIIFVNAAVSGKDDKPVNPIQVVTVNE